MIESWEQFFGCVAKMRELQKLYFQTKDHVVLGEAKKFETFVDECISERKARMDAQKNKAIQEDKHGTN